MGFQVFAVSIQQIFYHSVEAGNTVFLNLNK